MTKEAYIFGIAAIISIIFGIDLGLLYTQDAAANWSFGIMGFALIFFGIWLVIAAFQFSVKQGGRK